MKMTSEKYKKKIKKCKKNQFLRSKAYYADLISYFYGWPRGREGSHKTKKINVTILVSH